jgi:hypothetical protein
VKIEVTWTKPDGTKSAVEYLVSLDDPNRDDEGLQVQKSLAASQAHFHGQTGSAPPTSQLSWRIIHD